MPPAFSPASALVEEAMRQMKSAWSTRNNAQRLELARALKEAVFESLQSDAACAVNGSAVGEWVYDTMKKALLGEAGANALGDLETVLKVTGFDIRKLVRAKGKQVALAAAKRVSETFAAAAEAPAPEFA
ncbi:hypothetical protein RQP46_011186 [Phenoliferia psychrophenolica]